MLKIAGVIAVFFVGISSVMASSNETDEEVIFFPTYGYYHQQKGCFEVFIRGWIYEQVKNPAQMDYKLKTFCRLLNLDLQETENPIFRARAENFICENQKLKRVHIQLGLNSYGLNWSNGVGTFKRTLKIPTDKIKELQQNGNRIPFRTIVKEDQPVYQGEVEIIEEFGISVISDIDDTMMISQETDKEALIKNIFTKEFFVMPGTVNLYKKWEKEGMSFHYISANPWQLYPALSEFMKKVEFPYGSVHLRDYRWKNKNFFSFYKSSESDKAEAVEAILKCFPKRKFILIGDSNGRDPEIYGRCAKKYPDNIMKIFIRNVSTDGQKERFKKAFKSLQENLWTLFTDPSEIENFH